MNSVLLGPCLDLLKTLPDNSVDAVVTDPPYGLGQREPTADDIVAYLSGGGLDHGGDFMGRDWEIPSVAVWKECLRVLKPGAYLFSFAGTRTWDLMSVGIRAAGFENRDTIASEFGVSVLQWLHGQGFPKSLNVFKVLQKKVGEQYGGTCSCSVDEIRGSSAGHNAGYAVGEAVGLLSESGGAAAKEVSYSGIQNNSSDTKESNSVDSEVGQALGNDVRHRLGQELGVQLRNGGREQTPVVRDPNLSVETRSEADPLRELRQEDVASSEEFQTFKTPILLSQVRVGGPETTGLGHASVRERVEENSAGNTETRQSVSDLREDPRGQQSSSSRPPSETLPLSGHQSTPELGGSVRELSPSDRSSNDTSSGFDSSRSQPRSLLVDSLRGWGSADAQVCSWCGRPDQEWLNSYSGIGSALKPAWEPILVFRKPLEGTVVENVVEHGTGALNIDAARVGIVGDDPNHRPGVTETTAETTSMFGVGGQRRGSMGSGRWPANVIFTHSEGCKVTGSKKVAAPVINKFDDGMKPFGDGAGHSYTSEKQGDENGQEDVDVYECVEGCPVRILDEQSGDSQSAVGGAAGKTVLGVLNDDAWVPKETPRHGYTDSGGASRYFPQFEAPFFYTGKASKKEKNTGLDKFVVGFFVLRSDLTDEETDLLASAWTEDLPTYNQPVLEDHIPAELMDDSEKGKRKLFVKAQPNDAQHPTVKPVSLMRWLVRLACPEGGVVLDPYAGSGTTCVAAVEEGRQYIGMDRDPAFHKLATKRVEHIAREVGELREQQAAVAMMDELPQE